MGDSENSLDQISQQMKNVQQVVLLMHYSVMSWARRLCQAILFTSVGKENISYIYLLTEIFFSLIY